MTIKKTWLVALVLAVLLGAFGFNAYQQVKQGSEAYIYGYPLVLLPTVSVYSSLNVTVGIGLPESLAVSSICFTDSCTIIVCIPGKVAAAPIWSL